MELLASIIHTSMFTLPTSELWSLAKGAAMAAAGATLTAVSSYLSGIDFGPYGVVVGAILSVATNYLHKVATVPSTPSF